MDMYVNPTYMTPIFANNFQWILNPKAKAEENQQEFIYGDTSPFAHFVLTDFLQPMHVLEKMCSELEKSNWQRKENDLYSLSQTADLANFDPLQFPVLTKFRKFMETDVRKWLSVTSKMELKEKVSLTGSCYEYTDVLLPHNDVWEDRCFAFVLYLNGDWRPESGGRLQLFSDSHQLVKSLLPVHNSLVLFPVSTNSWHQVEEVIDQCARRLSINGWFYGCSLPMQRKIWPEISLIRSQLSQDITYEDVISWINPEYIAPQLQKQIRQSFEEESQIFLCNFLKEDKYNAVVEQMRSLKCWTNEQIAHKRNVKTFAVEELEKNCPVIKCNQLFHSDAMCLLMSQWTGLRLSTKRLHYLEQQQQISSSTSQAKEEEVTVSSQWLRFSRGSYTVLDDQSIELAESEGFSLEAHLFFIESEWKSDCGGTIIYTAKDESVPLLSIDPTSNCLALVYREAEVTQFVKYVNVRAGNAIFNLLSLSYFPAQSDQKEDSNSAQ